MKLSSAIVAAVFSSLLIAGCATKAERPTAEISRASTLIEQAEKAGAQRYAAADLQRARDKLLAADKAVEAGKEDDARHLAMEAGVDAELAMARAASGEAQKAAEEVHRSTETLQRESTRDANKQQ